MQEALTFPRPTGARKMWLQLSVLPPVPRGGCCTVLGAGPGGACCPLGVCHGEACPSKYFCPGYICQMIIVKKAGNDQKKKANITCRPTVQR